VRGNARHRLPAHQHHPRRGRGRAARPRVPSFRRARALRPRGAGHPRAARGRALSRADGVPGRSRARLLRPREEPPRARGSREPARRPRHGRHLPRAPRGDPPRRFPRARPAHRAHADPQALDRLEDVGAAVSARRVAVVGAGYSGLSAAVRLAHAGCAVTLFEANRVPGGRARRVVHRGTSLDNGQHILLGAYRETLELMREVGVSEHALQRLPLALHVAGRFALDAPHLPAPLNLAVALAFARGLSLADRLAALRFAALLRRRSFRPPAAMTVAELLAAQRQSTALRELLWAPLCVSALNTRVERADAAAFVAVLRRALFGRREDSDLLLPARDLSALLPEAAVEWLGERGADIALATRVVAAVPRDDGWRVDAGGGRAQAFDAVICAVAPHQAPQLLASSALLAPLAARIQSIEHEPIATVYLQYETRVR